MGCEDDIFATTGECKDFSCITRCDDDFFAPHDNVNKLQIRGDDNVFEPQGILQILPLSQEEMMSS